MKQKRTFLTVISFLMSFLTLTACGGGGGYIKDAYCAGADTYLSGEIGYHNLTDCKDMQINLVEAGHYYTENIALKNLARFVLDADSNIECGFYESNIINQI